MCVWVCVCEYVCVFFIYVGISHFFTHSWFSTFMDVVIFLAIPCTYFSNTLPKGVAYPWEGFDHRRFNQLKSLIILYSFTRETILFFFPLISSSLLPSHDWLLFLISCFLFRHSLLLLCWTIKYVFRSHHFYNLIPRF